MEFKAIARFVRISPYKLRPIADVVRGKNAGYGLGWLTTCGLRRAEAVQKVVASAVANAKQQDHNLSAGDLMIHELKVDHGPMFRYFKPGAMGRSNIYRKRLSHISVILKKI